MIGDPWAAWRLAWAFGETWLAAWTTIALRSALVARAVARGRTPPAAESVRMVVEKPLAAAEVGAALARAALRPGPAVAEKALEAAAAAIRPIRRRTRANARRLAPARGSRPGG